jgi:hypothetical protein
MHTEKEYGEDINKVYHSIMVLFDIERHVIKLIDPPNYRQ